MRTKRRGRRSRPLSRRCPLHIVFKADKKNLKKGLRSKEGFVIVNRVIKRYAKRFHVGIERYAICADHIHCVIRIKHRSLGQHFLRVTAGQIAQNFEKEGLSVTDTLSVWKQRPFSRVIVGFRDQMRVVSYVKLNELEASARISYKPNRLQGLSTGEWELLFEMD